MESRVLVSILATISTGRESTAQTLIEEHMPMGGILRAVDLDEATGYFLSQSGHSHKFETIHSFKVNGHELIHTFLTH